MTEKGGQIQWQIQGRGQRGLGPHVFLDQTDARRAEKKVFLKPTATPQRPPPLSPLCHGLDDGALALSGGLDPPLKSWEVGLK